MLSGGIFSIFLVLNLLSAASSLPEECGGIPCLDGMESLEGTMIKAQQETSSIGAEEDDDEPLYPALSPLEKDKAKHLLKDFRNKNPEKRKEFEKRMIDLGRGVIPFLIEQAATRHKTQAECIFNCLVALTDERDVEAMLECFQSKSIHLRRLSVIKIAAIRDEEHLDSLKKAYKDPDADIKLEAAIGLAYLGDPAGLGEIIVATAAEQPDPPARYKEAIPCLKGNVFTGHLFPYLLYHEDPAVRVVTAQMIGTMGDKKLVHVLAKALEDSHNLVQAATVNALRQLVNGEEPRKFDNMFELIEEVDKWKKKLSADQ